MRYLPTAIVDAHHHLWRLDLGHYPWLQEAYEPSTFILGDYAPLCRDFTPADYRAARAFAEKRAAALRRESSEVRYRRVAGALARRGFSSNVTSRVLREVIHEIDPDGD